MNRRSVTKGAAWLAPAIMVAAAAPSLAASPTAPRVVAGWADKCPGQSDVPGGWPKHGYRVTLTTDADVVVPVEVTLGNGRHAQILGDATRDGGTWSFVVDAGSSPSRLTVTVLVDGTEHTRTVNASPHCTGEAS